MIVVVQSCTHMLNLQFLIVILMCPLLMLVHNLCTTGRLAEVANQMGVSDQASTLQELSKGVSNMASFFGGAAEAAGGNYNNAQGLADEIAAWMGVGDVVVKGTRALPAAAAVSHKRDQY